MEIREPIVKALHNTYTETTKLFGMREGCEHEELQQEGRSVKSKRSKIVRYMYRGKLGSRAIIILTTGMGTYAGRHAE